jgi:hypothetical protein
VELVKTQTVGGWALVINALLAVILLLVQVSGEQTSIAFLLIGEALSLLLIIGLFALWPMLASAGRVAQVGLWCLGLATAVAFFVRLAMLLGVSDISESIPLTSAVLGCVGSVLVGWATIRTKTFHSIAGWLLIVGGTVNLIGGFLPASVLMVVIGPVSTLAQAGAFAGFGWTLLRRPSLAGSAFVEHA